MTTNPRRTRRRHSPELKTKILADCAQPGASVAQVAMAHGINANIVHSWRKHDRRAAGTASNSVSTFIPVTMEAPTDEGVSKEDHVAIEMHRAGLLIKLTWPLSAAEQLSSWLRELLR